MVHRAWESAKFTLSLKKNFVKLTIYVVISLIKPLLSRNFCENSVRRETFLVFPHCDMESTLVIFRKNSVKSMQSMVS